MDSRDINQQIGATSPRTGSPAPATAVYSSLDRLFSQPGIFDTLARDSYQYADLSIVDKFAAFSDPITVLGNLMVTLKEHHIPGPRLLRMKSEFTTPLGQGAQSEVLGFDESVLMEVGLDPVNLPSPIEDLTKVAVKRSRLSRPKRKPSGKLPIGISSEEFVFQCSAAHQEIDVLCRKSFRKHPNIVRLLSWGLCLDTLEEDDEESPRLPLLILERANCDLAEFLAYSSVYTLKNAFSDIRKICLDVGRGLEAIHEASIAHGDLKPENILIFEAPSGKWVAKLCDFGLSATESSSPSSPNFVEYRGTPGWRPPEYYRQDREPLSVRGSQRCDIFAFGLVVWSVFRHRGFPPLSQEEEVSGSAFGLATQQLTKFRTIPKHEHRRIILTVQGALLEDANARLRHPWKYLDNENYRRVGKRVKIWRELAKRTRTVRHTIKDFLNHRPNYYHVDGSPLNYPITARILSCCSQGWQPLDGGDPPRKPELVASPERHAAYLQAFDAYYKPLGNSEPGSISTFVHPTRGCFSEHRLRILHDSLAESIQRRDDVQAYALARLRSRFPVCCWKRIKNATPVINIIDRYMRGSSYDFVVLAWLCRGEIGAWELHDDQCMENIFRTICGRPRSFGYRFIRHDKLTIQQRIARFLLLLEHGARIEAVVNAQCETVFLRFLRLSGEFSKNGYGDLSIKEICISFKRIAKNKCIRPSTRFYMTGELPELGEDTTECRNTALHDSVLAGNYSAVESLIRSGFLINALNRDGRNALYVALQQREEQLHPSAATKTRPRRTDNNSLYRIIALLQQNTANSIDLASLSLKSSDIPLGWEKRELDVKLQQQQDSSSSSIVASVFYDVLSDSSTFIPPKFSLYEDRRLALATRKFSASGQTYYLDLLRFISPNSPEVEDEQDLSAAEIDIFDDHWFENEPWMPIPPGSSDGRDGGGLSSSNGHENRPLTPQDLAAVRTRRQRFKSISFGNSLLSTNIFNS